MRSLFLEIPILLGGQFARRTCHEIEWSFTLALFTKGCTFLPVFISYQMSYAQTQSVDIFVFCSPILFIVWQLPQSRICDFTVRCKGCGENIPAPVETMPDTWIVAECPLCRQRRSYLPPDIFRGRLSPFLLSRKPVISESRFR